MDWASATCSALTVLSPRCLISPCCCSSASALNLLGDRARHRRVPVVPAADAQVDHVEHVHAQAAQVVVDLRAQLRGLPILDPAALGVPHRPDLGDDVQAGGVGVQGFADELVGDVRAVEVGRVDVGDAPLDRLAQHGDGLVVVAGRAEDAGPGELHRAEAHPAQREVPGGGDGAAGSSGRHDVPSQGCRCRAAWGAACPAACFPGCVSASAALSFGRGGDRTEQREGLAGLCPGFRVVDDHLEPVGPGDVELLAAQEQLADLRVPHVAPAVPAVPDVGPGPEGPETLAADGQLADQRGELRVLGVGAGSLAQAADHAGRAPVPVLVQFAVAGVQEELAQHVAARREVR